MANFEHAVKILLNHEGCYVNDPDDSGGETKYGICKKYHRDIDIKNLTIEQASEIYKNEYWNLLRCADIENQKIADKLFDISVLIGIKNAVKFLQLAIKKCYDVCIVIDGKIGGITLGYLNRGNLMQDTIYDQFIKNVESHLISLNNDKYIKGWLMRLHS